MEILVKKPDLPDFLSDEEQEEAIPSSSSEVATCPPVLNNGTKLAPIPVWGGDNLHDLLVKAGHRATLDFLVRIARESILGDHLLLGYLQLSAYLEFKKIGKTYKTDDEEQFKQWLSLKDFGGIR